MDMRLGDFFRPGSYNEVVESLKSIRDCMQTELTRIKTELKRDNRRVILENLIKSSIENLDNLIALKATQTAVFAWATRNLYELNLITRFVLESEEHLNQWLAQIVQDEIEIWEGVPSRADKQAHSKEIAEIADHIENLRNKLTKYGLKPSRIPITFQLAKDRGLVEEHIGFYKIYSKFVHPSSILVNKPDHINLPVFFSVLTMNAQKYAEDTLNRISKATGKSE
jgi:hypothetical protein